jgi:hypothetical protein
VTPCRGPRRPIRETACQLGPRPSDSRAPPRRTRLDAGRTRE